MAMLRNLFWPSLTALTIAVLSAQMQAPYDAFSTLQPIIP